MLREHLTMVRLHSPGNESGEIEERACRKAEWLSLSRMNCIKKR